MLMINEGRAGYLGMGCEDRGGLNSLQYIIDLLGPFREIWEYARNSQGILRGKMCQSMETLFVPSRTVLLGARTVVSVLQLVSHIYSIKPNSC